MKDNFELVLPSCTTVQPIRKPRVCLDCRVRVRRGGGAEVTMTKLFFLVPLLLFFCRGRGGVQSEATTSLGGPFNQSPTSSIYSPSDFPSAPVSIPALILSPSDVTAWLRRGTTSDLLSFSLSRGGKMSQLIAVRRYDHILFSSSVSLIIVLISFFYYYFCIFLCGIICVEGI